MPKAAYPSINANDINSLTIPLIAINDQQIAVNNIQKIENQVNQLETQLAKIPQQKADILNKYLN